MLSTDTSWHNPEDYQFSHRMASQTLMKASSGPCGAQHMLTARERRPEYRLHATVGNNACLLLSLSPLLLSLTTQMPLAATSPYDTFTGQPIASQSFALQVLGPPAVGWTVQMMAFGGLVTYACSYLSSTAFSRDGPRLRWLLCTVLFLCTAQTGVTFFSIFHYMTNQGRSAEVLYGQTIGDAISTIPVGFEGALVQGYLTHRASGLFEARWAKVLFLMFTWAGIMCGLFGSVGYAVLSFYDRAGRVDEALPLTFQNVTGAWLWACSVVDITITACLGIQLSKKLGSVNSMTNSILLRLISVAVESASYTSVVALMGAILAFSFPPPSLASQAAAAFYGPLASCYAFALLHTLSTRAKLRKIQAKGTQKGVRSPQGGGVTLSFVRATHNSGMEEGEEVKFPPLRFLRHGERGFPSQEGRPMPW